MCFCSVYVVNVFNVIHVIQTSDLSIYYNSIQLDTHGVYGYQGYYYITIDIPVRSEFRRVYEYTSI